MEKELLFLSSSSFEELFPLVDEAFAHWFVGLSDGESCFCLNTTVNKWSFRLAFQIMMRADELPMLEEIRRVLGVGNITNTKGNKQYRKHPMANYWVSNKKELQKIVRFFDQYPLRSKKANDFQVWRLAVAEFRNRHPNPATLSHYYKEIGKAREYDASFTIEPFVDTQQMMLGLS